MEVGRAAHPGQVAGLLQRRRGCHRIRGLALGVEVEDGGVDGLVGGLVEVLGLEGLHDVRDGVLGQQHPAQHALLGLDVLRRGPQTRIGLLPLT